MTASEKIRQLYEAKLKANRPDKVFYELRRRRSNEQAHDDAYTALPPQEQEPLQEAWYAFHDEAHHKIYEDFFSKIEYCCGLSAETTSVDTFLKLIADRTFLFLEYCESGNDPEYPLLSKLVENCVANSRGYSKEAVTQVLKKGLIPTSAHKRYYRILDENLHELLDAKQMRERQIETLPQIEDRLCISINAQKQISFSKRDHILSDLFYLYICACEKYAYVRFQSRVTNGSRPWKAVVHEMSCYLDKHPCAIPGYNAIFFFSLFTQNTEKLLSGKLKEFTFEKLPPRKTVNDDPETLPARTSQRVYCNIELFDQLLEIFAPGDANKDYFSDAKYVFLQFSRYDRYWHYDMTGFNCGGADSPQYDLRFGRQKDYKDGVDYFGNLMRYHIKYCIPNQADQLLPVLISPGGSSWRPLAALTSFLLYESCQHIPTQQQLTHRIDKFLNTTDGEDTYNKYIQIRHNDSKLEEFLNSCCEKNGFLIGSESNVLYEPGTNAKAIQRAPRLVLEYALRFRLVQEATRNLEHVAEVLFQPLLPEPK